MRNGASAKQSHQRTNEPSGFQQVLLCRRCCVYKSLSKDRISLRQTSLDLAWLFPWNKGTKAKELSKTEAMHILGRNYQLTRRQLRLRQLHFLFTIHIQDYPVCRLHPSLTSLACEMHHHQSARVCFSLYIIQRKRRRHDVRRAWLGLHYPHKNEEKSRRNATPTRQTSFQLIVSIVLHCNLFLRRIAAS
jgi:hypothetical protein